MRYNEIHEDVDQEAIRALADQYFNFRGKVKIDSDGVISVSGIVIAKTDMETLPVRFAKTGMFEVSQRGLRSLEGSPHRTQNFYCHTNNLTSLKGGPMIVDNNYICENNQLTTLEGAPQVTSGFNCAKNKLTSLHGCPRHVTALDVGRNPLRTLDGLPEILNSIWLDYDEDLAMLRLAGKRVTVKYPDDNERHPISDIFDVFEARTGGVDRQDILQCQRALIKAGYVNNARW